MLSIEHRPGRRGSSRHSRAARLTLVTAIREQTANVTGPRPGPLNPSRKLTCTCDEHTECAGHNRQNGPGRRGQEMGWRGGLTAVGCLACAPVLNDTSSPRPSAPPPAAVLPVTPWPPPGAHGRGAWRWPSIGQAQDRLQRADHRPPHRRRRGALAGAGRGLRVLDGLAQAGEGHGGRDEECRRVRASEVQSPTERGEEVKRAEGARRMRGARGEVREERAARGDDSRRG